MYLCRKINVCYEVPDANWLPITIISSHPCLPSLPCNAHLCLNISILYRGAFAGVGSRVLHTSVYSPWQILAQSPFTSFVENIEGDEMSQQFWNVSVRFPIGLLSTFVSSSLLSLSNYKRYLTEGSLYVELLSDRTRGKYSKWISYVTFGELISVHFIYCPVSIEWTVIKCYTESKV